LKEWVGTDARDVICKRITLVFYGSEFDAPRVHTELLLNRFVKLCFGFTCHSAIRVGHDQNSIDAEKIGGENKCAKNVIGHSSTSISQNLCIPGLHSDEGKWADARVHASDYCESSTGRPRKLRSREVIAEDLIPSHKVGEFIERE
jgi:hypothetical protein